MIREPGRLFRCTQLTSTDEPKNYVRLPCGYVCAVLHPESMQGQEARRRFHAFAERFLSLMPHSPRSLRVVGRNRRIVEDPEGPSEQVWTVPATAGGIRLMRLSTLHKAHEASKDSDDA